MKIVVYVEGGGDSRKIRDDCRRGFGQLFERVVSEGDRPKVIACGARDSAFRDFKAAVHQKKEGFLILLVDSEGPVGANSNSWAHLKAQDGWKRPDGVLNEQAHLMVQCMESRLLADRKLLSQHYGKHFHAKSLPGQSNVEQITKSEVLQSLIKATSHTPTKDKGHKTKKNEYHKTKHGFALIARIDHDKLRKASQHANRFFKVLSEKALLS